mmetsp:Transcript_1732/g.4786  ORF Transcript_1732/g.4786 Transcript_1732/m.4786 type:complete len:156 (+) Transcript_1732:1444-1911(+)
MMTIVLPNEQHRTSGHVPIDNVGGVKSKSLYGASSINASVITSVSAMEMSAPSVTADTHTTRSLSDSTTNSNSGIHASYPTPGGQHRHAPITSLNGCNQNQMERIKRNEVRVEVWQRPKTVTKSTSTCPQAGPHSVRRQREESKRSRTFPHTIHS